jgi:hypothetical protein
MISPSSALGWLDHLALITNGVSFLQTMQHI